MKKLENNEFISRANIVHNYKYDYSLVEYKGMESNVTIICREHGVFQQTPFSHLQGCGCLPCSKEDKLSTNTAFVEKAMLAHDNKYNYSLVEYKNSKTKIKIICEKHGIFEQTPAAHLTNGCPNCCLDNKKLSINKFITDSSTLHNYKYDYSLVNYKTTKDGIKIICPEHGIFEQKLENHRSGKGCPICRESKGERQVASLLKTNNIVFEKQKTFFGCKNKRLLPFDFYLPEHNICIEYDGIQHFISQKIFGGENNLKYIQNNDMIKTKFCEDNNIKLLRIKYNTKINIVEVLVNIQTEAVKQNAMKGRK